MTPSAGHAPYTWDDFVALEEDDLRELIDGELVEEYWIVDPQARTLERLVLREGAYVIAASLEQSETFTPGSFNGLEIPLAKLWG
jgi:Uma2 family endonuclease